MGEEDRKWWHTFSKWMIFVVALGPFLMWPVVHPSTDSNQPQTDRPKWKTEAEQAEDTLWLALVIVIIFPLEVIALTIFAVTAGLRKRVPPSPIAGDPRFFQAAMEATNRRLPTTVGEPDGGDSVHWRILGLRPGTSAAQIKSRYRRLMRQHHPDHGGDPEKAKAIVAAYHTLMSQRASGTNFADSSETGSSNEPA